jgi:hypothetical protein
MAVARHQSSPVAPFPLVLGGVRKLNGAVLIETCGPAHPGQMLSCGRGVEARLLAIVDGHHALYKGGTRLGERGMVPLLQPGLKRTALQAYRLGQIRATLVAAPLQQVLGAVALRALAVDAVPTPWRHQETTTLTRYGASEAARRAGRQDLHTPAEPIPPRPASGHRQDGHAALTPVLLRLGVSRDGLPLRLGRRDGTTRDSPETPVAIADDLALGLEGVRGLVADRKADCQRTRG